jgi:hypothetical protein
MTTVEPSPGPPTRPPLLENLFWGAIALIGLILAVATLIASTRPSDKGWTVIVALVIALAFGVAIAVTAYVWLLRNIVSPQIAKLVILIKDDQAPGLVPAVLSAAQAIFIGATDEILNSDPILRWSLAAILAAVSLVGSLLSKLGKDTASIITGVGMVIISAGTVLFSAFTNHRWRSDYLKLSISNQIAVGGAIGISALILIATLIAIAKRRKSTSE